MGSRRSLAASAIFAAAFSISPSGQSQLGDPNAPLQFDYQERTGFPLAFEERLVPLTEANELVGRGLLEAPPVAVDDWATVYSRIVASAPTARDNVRVVRVFTDQPVFVKNGVALIPDPSQPESAVSPDDFNPDQDCDPDTGGLGAKRCISLHRDHTQNREAIAVLIAARTIIFSGTSRTGGMSLITLTENLWMQGREDTVDLSARTDPAPTIGLGVQYAVYDGNLPGLGASEDNPLTNPVNVDNLIQGNSPPWVFPTAPDLQWQYDRSVSSQPDHDFSQRDPCEDEEQEDKRACRIQREKRGLAGLPGGNWFGFSFRATTIRVTSSGQPGGNGGPGFPSKGTITCNNPGVTGPKCEALPPQCQAIGNPNQSACYFRGTPENPSNFQIPPNPDNLCACTDTCQENGCSVNYASENTSGQCVVTCGIDAEDPGFPGGHGGPGGPRGIVRLQVVSRVSGCSKDFSESVLSDPVRIHEKDERCVNGVADDGQTNRVDCASDFCSRDPNVLVCPPRPAGDLGDLFDDARDLADILGGIRDRFPGRIPTPIPIPNPNPNPQPDPFFDLGALNPFFDADPPPTGGVNRGILDLGGGIFTTITGRGPGRSIASIGDILQTPDYAPTTSIAIPSSLLEQDTVFQDQGGTLAFPSAEAMGLLSLFGTGGATQNSGGTTPSTPPAAFGFEDASAWTASSGTLALSSEHTEGNSSLAVPAVGWIELRSGPFGALGAVAPALTFDLRLPSPAVNPWWAGDVALVLDAPSVGLNNAWIGRVVLTGLPLGTFQRLSIALAEDTRAKLSQANLSDLRVKLQLNAAQGSGAYLFDNLSLGQQSTPGSAPSPGTLTFSIALPNGVTVDNAVLGAGDAIALADRAHAVGVDGSLPLVANAGTNETNLGVDSVASKIVSAGPVVLRDRAAVQAGVFSASTITQGNGVIATLNPNTPADPISLTNWSLEFPPATRPVSLEPDRQETIEPGSFAGVTVKSRATLYMSSGVYVFDSLTLEPQGVLSLDSSEGPIVVYLKDNLIFRGNLNHPGGAENLLIAYAGSAPIAIESSFSGTLVAPNATVRFGTGGVDHTGAAFARVLQLDPDVEFVHRPFGFWSLVAGVGAGTDRLSQLLSFVREALIDANPTLEPSPQFVIEMARVSANAAVRDSLVAFRDAAGAVSLGGTFVRRGDDLPGRTPDLLLNARDRWGQIGNAGGGTAVGDIEDFVCANSETGLVFAGKAGKPGSGGPGGAGAEKRCHGFHPTTGKVCVQAPTTPGSECRQGQFGVCQTPNFGNPTKGLAGCFPRYEYPNDSGQCPPNHVLVSLESTINVGGIPFPIRLPAPCPVTVQGAGGVECAAPNGASGVPARPPISQPTSAVRALSLGGWAYALDQIHPLELTRRVGRGNTHYKRGNATQALARYLASLRLVNANAAATPGCAFCSAFTCPENPRDIANDDEKKALCALSGDVQALLRQLARGENYYGYLPDFVPPTSVRTRDPLSVFDLATQVSEQLDNARTSATLWETYGQITQGKLFDQDAARLEIGRSIEALDDEAGPGGVLTLEFELADEKVDDAIAELRNIHDTVDQLEETKVRLSQSAGGFEVDIGALAGAVVMTAATAYGGPLAGAAASLVWSGAASPEAKEAFGGASTNVEIRNLCAQTYDAPKEKPDFSECGKKLRDGAMSAVVEEIGKPAADQVSKALMQALEMGQPKASNGIANVVLDATIAELMVDAFQKGNELGQNLLARGIAQEKIFSAHRQISRLEIGINSLNTFRGSNNFPAPEIQLQIANLALSSAANSVELAGEYFFLFRRGVERDVVSLDPATGDSLLTVLEGTPPILDCEPPFQPVETRSLDINFVTLDCFQSRVDRLGQILASTLTRSADFLETADTSVPFSNWELTTDAQDEPAYVFEMPISFETGQIGTREGQLRQKVEDMTFFLQTNDGTPAAIRMRASRPVLSQDVYFVGPGPDPDDNLISKFQTFDIARGSGAPPGSPLAELLRDRTRYEHEMFACNAQTPGSGGIFEQCRLSNLGQGDRAFLQGRSLIGTYAFSVRVADLAGRIPTRLFAEVKYTYER